MDLVRLLNHLFKHKVNYQPITTGKFNSSFYVNTDNKEYVLRIAPPAKTPVLFYEKKMMRREPEIHKLILENTKAPVAEIYDYDFTGTVIDNDWLLMEKLSGTVLSQIYLDHNSMSHLYTQLGKVMRQVHNIGNNWYGYPYFIKEKKTFVKDDNWAKAFFHMWKFLIDDIVAAGFYTEQEALKYKQLLKQYIDCFNHEPSSSLLHMDIWAQNILTDKHGNLTGIVDWDRGLWGDVEIDFSVMNYCGTYPPAFLHGYGKLPAGLSETSYAARIRAQFYLLYEHQKYIFIRSMRGRNYALAQRYKNDCINLFKQLEK